MFLVVGATGSLGFDIVSRLRERGHAVRAVARPSSTRTSALAALGAEPFAADLKDPQSLRAACQGRDTVISTASATVRRTAGDSLRSVDRDGHLALIDAARAAGVRRLVFVSVSPNLQETCALVRYKRQVEAAVRSSGMEWVILQPSAFMEIWLSPLLGWDLRQGQARIVGNGGTRLSLVSSADVAAFATAAAERVDVVNEAIPIGGPEAVTPNEIVALAQALTGRVFRVQRIPAFLPRTLSALLRPVAPVLSSLMDLAAQMARHDDVIDSADAARRLGITPTSVRDFAIRAASPDEGPHSEAPRA